MKRYVLEAHSEFRCRENVPYHKLPDLDTRKAPTLKDSPSERHVCEGSPENDIYFLNNDFVMVTYHRCLFRRNDYDQKAEWIEQLINGSKKIKYYKTYKSQDPMELIKYYKESGNLKKKYITQVHYTYTDMTGKEYAIVTYGSAFDILYSKEEIHANFKAAKDYIMNTFSKSYEIDNYIKNLYDLYLLNTVKEVKEMKVLKTVDELIKEINSLTK